MKLELYLEEKNIRCIGNWKRVEYLDCVVWHFSWGDANKCLFIPDEEPMTDESNDYSKVWLGELVTYVGYL